MKIRQLLLLAFFCITHYSWGQGNATERLFPIEQIQQGLSNKYVYKRQVIENPLALQIPLLESKDPDVSFEFSKFKTSYRDWETDRKSTRLNSSHRL